MTCDYISLTKTGLCVPSYLKCGYRKRKACTDTVNHQCLPPNFSLIPQKNMAPPQIQYQGVFSPTQLYNANIMLCRQSFQISVAYHHKTFLSHVSVGHL